MTKALLDTHVFFWLMVDDPTIDDSSKERLQEFDKIYISPLSIWELSLLKIKNRIEYNFDLDTWTNESLRKSGFTLLNCTPEILIESNNLPGNFHRDPCDQIIVASARVLNATLFTRDKKILDYDHVLSIYM